MKLRKLMLGLPVLLVACGGAPSTPTPVEPSPPAATARDGWTEAPVVAEFTPSAPARGTRVSARANGFLVREQMFDGTPLYLWPQSEDYVSAVVYRPAAGNILIRWSGSFTVTATPDLLNDPTLRAVIELAVAEASRVTGLGISVGATGQVMLSVDPTDPVFANSSAGAATYNTRSGGTIISSRVVFANRDALNHSACPNVVLHELGHVLGLGHSFEASDVMTFPCSMGSKSRVFGPSESIALKLMYRWRRAGNSFPDRAPEVAGFALETRTFVVVD